MGKFSREKGKRGEREAARLLTTLLGEKFVRGRQFSGSQASPDVKGDTALHVEVKRDESTLSLKTYTALEQAKADAGTNIPFVMSRRNGKQWVFVIDETNLVEFCREVARLLS